MLGMIDEDIALGLVAELFMLVAGLGWMPSEQTRDHVTPYSRAREASRHLFSFFITGQQHRRHGSAGPSQGRRRLRCAMAVRPIGPSRPNAPAATGSTRSAGQHRQPAGRQGRRHPLGQQPHRLFSGELSTVGPPPRLLLLWILFPLSTKITTFPSLASCAIAFNRCYSRRSLFAPPSLALISSQTALLSLSSESSVCSCTWLSLVQDRGQRSKGGFF